MVAAALATLCLFGLVVALAVKPLLIASRIIDTANTYLGRIFAWALLIAVVVAATNAIIRKVFDTSSNAWLELQWVLFGAVFLVCASWTLLSNEHIRIDIVANMLPRRVRSWIDYIGHLFFLLPMTIVMIVTSWPFFLRSFLQQEQSSNAGGLILYPSKFLVLLGFVLLFLQGVSELIKRTAILRGILPDAPDFGHHATAEAEAERLREVMEAETERHTPPKS